MREPSATPLAGWGRCPVVAARVVRPENLARGTAAATLSRGLGRAYGDAALPAVPGAVVAETVRADRLLGFDPVTGILRAEAGLSLQTLNRWSIPRGWFTPVTPGTQFVTLGGMVAADVHGKNHHNAGCFGEHLIALRLRLADGALVECSPTADPELFYATIGGMGLTGHILEVTVRLAAIPSPWIRTESIRVPDLDAMVAGLLAAGSEWSYTVGWMDGMARGRRLGRGILMKGRWAAREEAPAGAPPPFRSWRLPLHLVPWAVRPSTVGLFNRAYFGRHGARARRGFSSPDRFFYPLDVIEGWNRLYGKGGFVQYQFVVPHAPDHAPTRAVLERALALDATPYLSVIKELGAEGSGMLSFPCPGVTVALDLPWRQGIGDLVKALNDEVARHGGRIYLAKDALTDAATFRAMEHRLPAWEAVRRRCDPDRRIRSALSARLLEPDR